MSSQLIYAGMRLTADLLQSVAPLAVIKGADESVLNSTTMQNDDDLFIAYDANATYIFDCYLDFEGSAQGAGDLKWTWTVPSGTLRYQPIYTSAAGSTITGTTFTGSGTVTAGTNGAASLRGASMNGTLITSAAGTLQLQWAQNTLNNSTPTIVHAQSYLALWRVS